MPLTKALTFFRNKSELINFFKNRFDFNEFFFLSFFLILLHENEMFKFNKNSFIQIEEKEFSIEFCYSYFLCIQSKPLILLLPNLVTDSFG